ncbi:MAG: MinD/ParA family protein [Bacillaceae bacterium]|nr:MinD/ParA family protein [Bacillaceae bacterium]
MSDQAQKLRNMISRIQNKEEAKTIAVVSGKGGVGKSNFALNFAIKLSQQKKRVLLFDLDIGMGNIDILLGLTPKKTIVNMFEESLSIKDVIEKGPESLSYVAAGSGLTEIFNLEHTAFADFLQQLQNLMFDYDYIIFDMGAGMSVTHMNFVLASQECFVITTTEPTSIMDAYSVIKFICSRRKDIPLYLMINRATSEKDGRQAYHRLAMAVEQFLDKKVKLLGILPDDRQVVQAVQRQTPFILFNHRSNVSQSLSAIVKGYTGQSMNQKAEPFKFISRLKAVFSRKVD